MCSKLSPPGIYLLRWDGLGGRRWRGGVCSQAMSWQVGKRQTWTCLRAQPCPPDTSVAADTEWDEAMSQVRQANHPAATSQSSVGSFKVLFTQKLSTSEKLTLRWCLCFPLKKWSHRFRITPSVWWCVQEHAVECGFLHYVLKHFHCSCCCCVLLC